MKTKILILLCLGFMVMKAQQEAMYTHYMFNTQSVNPAYAGSRDALTVTALHRSMWLGFNGAPTTQTLTLHSPLINQHWGAGLSVMHDVIGPTSNSTFSLDLAYRVNVTKKAKLAFGVKPSLVMRSARLTSLELDVQNDPAFASNTVNQFKGNVGAGLYFYTPRFYTGLSSPGLIQNKLSIAGVSQDGIYKRHFFYIVGAMIKLNNAVEFKPTALVKMTEQAPMEADLTASFVFNNKFWAGAMYRTGDGLGALLGINLTEQLAVGYSFDWSLANSTLKYNGGSHELMLRYDFIYHNQKQIISPRYF